MKKTINETRKKTKGKKIRERKTGIITSAHKGLWGELCAIIYLWLNGFIVLKWRYHNPFGEIDVIAKKGKMIIFVEVKIGGNMIDCERALTFSQWRRVEKGGDYFMRTHYGINGQIEDYVWRYDAILVNRYFLPHHIQGAWESQ